MSRAAEDGFSRDEVHSFLAMIRALLAVVRLSTEIHEEGLRLAELHKLSIYDAMIVAAAVYTGCDILFSEDLQDGFRIENLTIVNPLEKSA